MLHLYADKIWCEAAYRTSSNWIGIMVWAYQFSIQSKYVYYICFAENEVIRFVSIPQRSAIAHAVSSFLFKRICYSLTNTICMTVCFVCCGLCRIQHTHTPAHMEWGGWFTRCVGWLVRLTKRHRDISKARNRIQIIVTNLKLMIQNKSICNMEHGFFKASKIDCCVCCELHIKSMTCMHACTQRTSFWSEIEMGEGEEMH